MYTWATRPEPPESARTELGLDASFDDQGTAEAWLSANYEELVAAGVHEVTLYQAERLVYGPMSLDA